MVARRTQRPRGLVPEVLRQAGRRRCQDDRVRDCSTHALLLASSFFLFFVYSLFACLSFFFLTFFFLRLFLSSMLSLSFSSFLSFFLSSFLHSFLSFVLFFFPFSDIIDVVVQGFVGCRGSVSGLGQTKGPSPASSSRRETSQTNGAVW